MLSEENFDVVVYTSVVLWVQTIQSILLFISGSQPLFPIYMHSRFHSRIDTSGGVIHWLIPSVITSFIDAQKGERVLSTWHLNPLQLDLSRYSRFCIGWMICPYCLGPASYQYVPFLSHVNILYLPLSLYLMFLSWLLRPNPAALNLHQNFRESTANFSPFRKTERICFIRGTSRSNRNGLGPSLFLCSLLVRTPFVLRCLFVFSPC